jgi:hypothetical protein
VGEVLAVICFGSPASWLSLEEIKPGSANGGKGKGFQVIRQKGYVSE